MFITQKGNALLTGIVVLAAMSGLALSGHAFISRSSVSLAVEKTGHVISRALTVLATETSTAADGFPAPPVGLIALSDGYQVPSTSAAPKTDSAGTILLYCPWDSGTTNSSSGRLTGDAPGTDTSIVMAIVASGPDKQFQTSCADAKQGISRNDDLVRSHTVSSIRLVGGMRYYLPPVDCENAATPITDLAGSAANCSNSRSRLDLLPTSGYTDGALITIRKSGKVFQWVASVTQWREASGSGGGYSMPDDFSFDAVVDAAKSTLIVSNTVTLSGVSAAAPISIDGVGQYQINGGAWTSNLGSVKPGDTLAVRVTSSSSSSTALTTWINIAGKTKSFTVTTGSAQITELFSAWRYNSTGSSQVVANGIDLQSKGGMVWTKYLDSVGNNYSWHAVADTARGGSVLHFPNSADPQTTSLAGMTFSTTGYTTTGGQLHNMAGRYGSWTFRKGERFFDIVTWTGNGAGDRAIPHALGVSAGMVIVKATNLASSWYVYHRSLGGSQFLYLNSDLPRRDVGAPVPVAADASNIYVHQFGGEWATNTSGVNYVAYVFGHDTSSNGLIQAGSFRTDSFGVANADLGWEPQFVLVKSSSLPNDDWKMLDTTRGWAVARDSGNGYDAHISANSVNSEGQAEYGEPHARGFRYVRNGGGGADYVYLAIRRPSIPTIVATNVFGVSSFSHSAVGPTTAALPFSPDAIFGHPRDASSIYERCVASLLTGRSQYLNTASSVAEVLGDRCTINEAPSSAPTAKFDLSNPGNYVAYSLKRAKGFFDIVAYNGTGNTQSVSHNLGVEPDFMLVKARLYSGEWATYVGSATGLQTDTLTFFNRSDSATSDSSVWPNPGTASTISVGTSVNVNRSGTSYVGYLFASAPGVSKIGTYQASGSDIVVDAGFTGSPRFVLIKRLDNIGDWYIFDAVRGIVNGGSDPAIRANLTQVEIAGQNLIEPTASGFIAKANTSTAESGGKYLYMAIK